MRVISGTAKGRRLLGPKKGQRMRPVLDQVKEAIFSILFSVEGAEVLDLFAGTGAMGIEALSRGAARATFVDVDPLATGLITRNLDSCHLYDRATVLAFHVERAIRQCGRQGAQFDLIFIDPPYEKGQVNPALAQVARRGVLRAGGRIVIEHHPRETIQAPEGLALTDQRKYGQTLISFLQPAVPARTDSNAPRTPTP